MIILQHTQDSSHSPFTQFFHNTPQKALHTRSFTHYAPFPSSLPYMASSLIVRAYFRSTKPKQVDEFELSIIPCEPNGAPSPFPAPHPSRAPSPTSTSSNATISVSNRSGASTNSLKPSPTPTPTRSMRPSHSASHTPTSEAGTIAWEEIELTGNRVVVPHTPVLRPVEYSIALWKQISMLQLDFTTPMPATPVLRPRSDEESMLEIPDLELDAQDGDLVCP
jgi:hypothetical protein